MGDSILCRVKNCRFNKFHLTMRHQCGGCFEFGHGQMECNEPVLRSALTNFDKDMLEQHLHCTIPDCVDPHTHLTSGHSCRFCFSFNKELHNKVLHKKKCPLNPNQINPITDNVQDYTLTKDIDFDTIASKYSLQIGECIILRGGMGSAWYIRINKDTLLIEFIMIHSDSWGQYGDDSSDMYRLNAFVYDYKIRLLDSYIGF